MDYNNPKLDGKYLGTITKDFAELQPVDMFTLTCHMENVVLELR